MSDLFKSRSKAVCGQPITLFLSGFKVNRPWKFHRRFYLFRLLRQVNRELEACDDIGFLGQQVWRGNPDISIQYWRSYAELVSFARDKHATHFPAWLKFNEYVAQNGDIGLWHEIYVIQADQMEGLYRNIEPLGLGRFVGTDPMRGNCIQSELPPEE